MSFTPTRLPDRVKASLWAGSLGALVVGAAMLGVSLSSPALAENIRGAATGPTTAPGFSHPEQYIHLKDVKPADNMYPVIQHPEQDKAAQAKLASLAAKTGKKPNIMIFLLDDVGWGDPGFNGGGVAVGNATPNMDRLANEGLLLTSAYSLENTLIIFTSDNGPECEIPPHGRTPFRGCKGSSWEGGVRVPTFVYWKGMIAPRKSDGLFDLADILPTALDLAGVPGAKLAELFPKSTYIDGVDQASFLIADDGLSARRSRIYTLNQYYSAIRIDEFKGVATGEIENGVVQKGFPGGFSGPVFTDTGGAIVFNLYTNPQEDVSIGIRHIPEWRFCCNIRRSSRSRLPVQQSSGLRRRPHGQRRGESVDQGARIRAANALAANDQGLVRHARGLLLPECRLLAQRVMRLIFEPSSVRLYMRPAGSRMKPRTGLVRFSVSMAPPAPSVTTATDPSTPTFQP